MPRRGLSLVHRHVQDSSDKNVGWMGALYKSNKNIDSPYIQESTVFNLVAKGKIDRRIFTERGVFGLGQCYIPRGSELCMYRRSRFHQF